MTPPAGPDFVDQGLAAHQRGDLAEAERLYAAAVRITPDDPDAQNLLGVCLLQRGDATAAQTCFEAAVRLDPQAAEFHFHLGRAKQAAGQLPAARQHYLDALRVDDAVDGAWRGLGETSQVLRCFSDAARAWRHVLDASPADANAWNNLGLAELHLGNKEQSEVALKQAVGLRPDFVLAWSNLLRAQALGDDSDALLATADRLIEADPKRAISFVQKASVLQRLDRSDDALVALKQAIALDPNEADAHFALGMLHTQRGEHTDAAVAYKRAGELCPDNPLPDMNVAHSLLVGGDPLSAVRELQALDARFADRFEIKIQLVEALARASRYREAIEPARQAVALKPDDPDGLSALGRMLAHVGEQSEAEALYRRALTCTPWPPIAAGNLASMLCQRGQLAEGLELHRDVLRRFPGSKNSRSNYLLQSNGDPTIPPETRLAEHKEWGDRFAPVLNVTHANTREPDRKLRIGYVSPDFREHSVAFFIEPVLSNHNRSSFTAVCYDNVAMPDRMTAHLRSHADEWRRVVGLSDIALAELIRRDRIDILVDLAGHTADNRLATFALKPAPVQVAYLGYPNTTGLKQVDYRLIDALTDPPGTADAWHTETLVRLPAPFVNYRPPIDAPAVAPLPALGGSPFTFGSFNALSKLNADVFDAWAAVLRAVPESLFLMKANGLADPQTQDRLAGEFAARGIGRDRLRFAQRTTTYIEHMRTYHRVDIALDTFPYNGTTTTCEALYMGVPVLTPAGKSHVSRVSLSLLTSIGLVDWIAADTDDFVRLAVRKAANHTKLAAVRASLRQRMQRSPLMDPRTHVSHLEAAYRGMWRDYCRVSPAVG